MNFISIHDTHRLPYNNATITATRTQEGDTTPLEFFNAVDEESLGYEVYTNARGYICDRDGNLYTKGVFVREDAYVTATLGDGASTNWIVRPDSDITINDGELLGRIEDNQARREQEELEGKTFVLFDGHWHLKLHSANTPDNRRLRLKDLDEVPAFNEWKEVEQVVELKVNQTTVVVEEYTKVLVLQWSGTKPSDHDVVDISVDTQVVDGRHRYAQHCLVYNQTGMRVVLKNTSSPQSTIGIIAPDGTMNMGLFFLESNIVGEWIADDRLADWDDGLDADQAGDNVVYVEGIPTVGPIGNEMFEVKITDRTPNVLHIVARDINFNGASPKPGEIKIKLTGENITKSRDITVWFTNNGGGEASNRPALFFTSNPYTPVFELYTASLTRVRIPTTTGDFTDGNNLILLQNADSPSAHYTKLNTQGGGGYVVPRNCQRLVIENATAGGTVILYFQEELNNTRIDVSNTSGSNLWIDCRGIGLSDTQVLQVCRGNSTINFTVQNTFRLITVEGYNKFSTIVKGDDGGERAYAWFDMQGSSNKIKLNLHRAGYIWDNDSMMFGDWGTNYDDLVVRVPLNQGETKTFYIDISEYVATGNNIIRLHLGLLGIQAASSNDLQIQERDWGGNTVPTIITPRNIVKAVATRSSDTISVIWSSFESEAVLE